LTNPHEQRDCGGEFYDGGRTRPDGAPRRYGGLNARGGRGELDVHAMARIGIIFVGSATTMALGRTDPANCERRTISNAPAFVVSSSVVGAA
jgi:hypothetical protein